MILKFYYNLSYELLPMYLETYMDCIDDKDDEPRYELRPGVRPLIKLPKINHNFAKSCVLYQLVHIINILQIEKPNILEKIKEKSHSYYGFSHNVKQQYLADYSFECNLVVCYRCGRT